MPHAPCIRCTRSLPTPIGFAPDEIKWKGDGEEPSRDALIEWFKVNHPAQASEAESKIRRRELEIESGSRRRIIRP